MANPAAFYTVMSPSNGLVPLHISFTVGSSGAVGTVTGGLEMGTPTHDGTGVYSFPLLQGWYALVDGDAWVTGAFDATKGTLSKLTTDNSTSTSSPKVTFTFFRPDTQAAADPATGDIVRCILLLKRYDKP